MLLSRSPAESQLYMELHPCACGEFGLEWSEHRLIERGEKLLSIYSGECFGCAADRMFEFTLAPEPAPAPPAFGGDRPSQLIDPGQFLAVSREAAESVPPDPAGLAPEDLHDAYEALAFAVEAVEEVLKFIPAGESRVPSEAFRSELGHELYEAGRDEFSRACLESVREGYLRQLRDYDLAFSAALRVSAQL